MTNATKCQCEKPGYCELLQREMGNARWNECKNVPHYFEMFLSEVGKERRLSAPPPEPCIHFGEQTGLIECPTCSGTVKVKTFACAVHGECTLGKSLDDVACCAGCDDYRP